MKYDYQIAVIGAGSAGLSTAAGAAGLGAKVALIEQDKMGGECLNSGCVPSKSFLRCAHQAAEIKNSSKYGILASFEGVDMKALMQRVQGVIREIEPHDSAQRFKSLGVDVISGQAQITGPNSIKADGREISAKYIVIATGSEAIVPPIKGLLETKHYTNRDIFSLEKLPEKLVILGGGPIGLELGQGFCHLGSKVAVIDMAPKLFTKDDREVGALMEKIMRSDGMEFYLGATIVEIRKDGESTFVRISKDGKDTYLEFDTLLVALGRAAVTDGLGLADAGVATDKRGYIITNKRQQTSTPSIYACGDICGPYQFTHMAGYQAGIILRNIIFKLPAKANYSAVPWVTYAMPEVAHVGYTEDTAREKGLLGDISLEYFNEIDRSKTEDDTAGFLKIVMDKKKRIIGTTIVGKKAGEMIGLSAIAIKKKIKATYFMNMIFPYPTESEIYALASRNIAKQSLKPWMKKIIRMLI
ncbi:dihydrolipoyl dehydrogenase family protein [Desulfobacterium sp. N47]|uniref:dihydrolipoyl dehydrogenase family protein n=1 Tax=Desulfobacterium sp. N47 TaxID=3115210 RepID=UPI003C960C57